MHSSYLSLLLVTFTLLGANHCLLERVFGHRSPAQQADPMSDTSHGHVSPCRSIATLEATSRDETSRPVHQPGPLLLVDARDPILFSTPELVMEGLGRDTAPLSSGQGTLLVAGLSAAPNAPPVDA